MDNNDKQKRSEDGEAPRSDVSMLPHVKKRYSPPALIHQENLRDITLGPTPGIGESGNASNYRPPTLKSGSVEGDSAGGMWEEKFFDD